MERRRMMPWLGAEAAACLALALLWRPEGGTLAGATAFPFAPLGRLLRRMSLSGNGGNAGALGVFALVAALPLAWLFVRVLKRRARAEDALLPLMSALAGFALYGAVNPGVLVRWLGPAAGVMGTAVLGGAFWSAAVAYLALRVLRACRAADSARLLRCGFWALGALAAAAVFGAFGASPLALMNALASLRTANPDSTALGTTYALLGLRCAVSAGAYLLDLAAVLAGWDLLAAWGRDHYSPETVSAADTLARRCGLVLTATALTSLGLQLAQLAFASRLYTQSYDLSVPLTPMVLALGALLLARSLRAGKALKDDNDLFI